MSKTIRDNKSNTHLIVDSLTVIKKIKGGGISQINDNIEALRQAQQTLSENTKDYWTSLTADNVINPEEKKILYKEWKIIETEYIALLEEAAASGLIENSQAIIDYKNNYEALYSYIITTLKVFDNMTTTTKLNNRELFIKRYNDYYTSRDKLRNAIKDGELTDLDNTFQGKVDNLQDQIKDISQGSVADGSITVDKLSADMRDSIKQFEAASATGFLTDDILNAIDTSVTASSDALNLRIDEQGKSTKLYLQLYSDKINSIIDDAKRVTRSHLKQTSDSITLSVVNLAKETATQLKLTDEAITAMATNLRAETTAALKITSNRITEMVTGGSSEAYLSLSVGIPYFITPTKYSEWETKLDESGKEYLRNVYAKTNVGTDQEPVYYYVMRAEAAPAAIKTLTTKLRALDKLSSQIVVDADMIQIKGDTIFSAEGTLKEAYYDYNSVAPTTFISALLDENAIFDGTVIKGGFIKTGLIDADMLLTDLLQADAVFAGKITVGNQLLSENYETSEGKDGYMFNKDGTAILQNADIKGAITARGLIFQLYPGDIIAKHFYWSNSGLDQKFKSFVNGTVKLKIKLKVTNRVDDKENWAGDPRFTPKFRYRLYTDYSKPFYDKEYVYERKTTDQYSYYNESDEVEIIYDLKMGDKFYLSMDVAHSPYDQVSKHDIVVDLCTDAKNDFIIDLSEYMDQ